MLPKVVTIIFYFLGAGLLAVSEAQNQNLTFIIFAKDLPPNLHDDHSLIDPVVKVYESSSDDPELKSIGKTETIFDEINPEFVEVFWITYKPGTGQKLRFEMRDRDILNQDDAVGGAEMDLDDYVNNGENMTLPINGVDGSTLSIQKTNPIKFKLSVSNLPKFDKPPAILASLTNPNDAESDPYVKCYFRRGIGGPDRKFATTTTVSNSPSAEWDVIEFGNYQPGRNMYLRFKVKDEDVTSKDDTIGIVVLEADSFVNEKSSKTLKLESEEGDTGATITITPM